MTPALAINEPQAPEFLQSPRCPLCHVLDVTVTAEALAAGAGWTCVRCGQSWSAARLGTAAAYARYVG
jgi:hypothetical protein